MDKINYEMRLAQWTSIIGECNMSGMSKKSWCLANYINEKQFYYWQRRIRQKVVQEHQPTIPTTATFVELCTPSPTVLLSEQPDDVLRIGNCILEIRNTLSPTLLHTMVQVMLHV